VKCVSERVVEERQQVRDVHYATEATEADSQRFLAALCNAGDASGCTRCMSRGTATR